MENYKRIIQTLQSGVEYQIHDLIDSPADICVLPNDEILISGWEHDSLVLYKSNFESTKQMLEAKIDGSIVLAMGLALNNMNQLYISDWYKQQIILKGKLFGINFF